MEIALDSNSPVSTEWSYFFSWPQSFQTLTKPRQEFIQDGIIPSSMVVLYIEQAEDLLQHLPLETGSFLLLDWDDFLHFQGNLKSILCSGNGERRIFLADLIAEGFPCSLGYASKAFVPQVSRHDCS
jgi:hypothetical protein